MMMEKCLAVGNDFHSLFLVPKERIKKTVTKSALMDNNLNKWNFHYGEEGPPNIV